MKKTNNCYDMKIISIRVLVAVSMLSTTSCTSVSDQNKEDATPKSEREEEVKPEHSFEGNYDWKQHMVIADRKCNDLVCCYRSNLYFDLPVFRIHQNRMGGKLWDKILSRTTSNSF